MGDLADGPPVVSLPERLDRRLRLGPFESARDALKFVTYAAAGAIVVPFTSPYLWLVFVGGGFALCVVRSDGQSLDERAVACLLWRLRTARGGLFVTAGTPPSVARHGIVAIGPGRYLAVLRTGGTPITYLPPAELARRFELYRDLLRSSGNGLMFLVTASAMRPGPVLPGTVDAASPDHPAHDGYSELVGLLCRRRQLRRVYLALVNERTGPDGISDLEARVETLTDRLTKLGVRPARLRDRHLTDAARRWGWS
jgi:hypothetical protein